MRGDPPWPYTGYRPVTSDNDNEVISNSNVTQRHTAGDNRQINIKDNIPVDPGRSLEHTRTCKEDPDIFYPKVTLLSLDRFPFKCQLCEKRFTRKGSI